MKRSAPLAPLAPLALVALASFAVFAGCSANASDPPTGASSGAAEPGAASPSDDPEEAPAPGAPSMPGAGSSSPGAPARPAPQSTVRSCGVAKTTALPLSTHVEWGTFLKTPLGSLVVSPAPLTIGAKAVMGSASRLSAGASSISASVADESRSAVLLTLGFHAPDQLGASQLSTFAGAGGATLPSTWYVEPTATTLTYFQGFGVRELAWTMDNPTPTTAAASPNDSFVFGIIPGAYFGIELSLSFPSDCAVGALSDVLGRAALLRDASSAQSGIFAAGKTAAVESTLVGNGVSMQVRVTANKKMAAVESLLSSTTCSPGRISDCATLLSALTSAGAAFQASLGSSDVAKLQTDSDPGWSPSVVMTLKLSTVTP